MSNDMGHGSSGYGNELTGISSRCQLKWFVVLNGNNMVYYVVMNFKL